jgi:hypothetical protein
MKTTTDLLAVSICVCAGVGAIYPTDGLMTSSRSFTVRSEYPYAAMIKIMMHIRTIQKGTRTRFCQNTGRCAMLVMHAAIARR